jgi:hypothetical protein
MKSKVVEDADVVTYVVVCDPGDEAVSALMQFARSERLEAAQITAVGAFEHATVGPARRWAVGSALLRGGSEQAQGAGRLDRLGPAVRAELGVQVAHVSLDRARRDGQLPGDLGRRQVGRQVTQYADLAVAERLERRLRAGRRRRGPVPG